MLRKINKLLGASSHRAGEHMMYQPLPNPSFDQIDPFLLVHHHGPHEFEPYNQGLPFGPHPHRGFETLTFIYEGSIEHADSQGFKSVINPGGVQWMTAGRGIVHSENVSKEMREEGGKMEIIQLWMNLPAKLKMTPPQYQGLQQEDIPVVKSEDGKVATQVISGEFKGQAGKAKSITDLQIFNVKAEKGGQETFQVETERNILLYVLNGELVVNEKLVTGHQMVHFSHEGTDITIMAQTNSRFILCTGVPYNEPLVAQGPFVMNTTTEILQAMRDYQQGKMGIM
ncbi:pirin family protein [Emticicia sp. CRIBPO]|uniref:pirin family protein n=1 Tax=Emticicia sp. CRIBPO TaxID=2683258 RepID=UPI00141314EF|nr:pirin family protein [Emticicia sp. CRIBPO]NBA88880.1 pirin family protein [Emticicia sp. CRIBPO]